MRFTKYPRQAWAEILGPEVSDDACDLVSKLVLFESGWRITASEVSEDSR